MVGRKVGVIPNEEPPVSERDETARAAQPNTGQGATRGDLAERNDRAVAAGHGNQPLDNETRPDNDSAQLKPGAQPEGELSGVSSNGRNEDIERAGIA